MYESELNALCKELRLSSNLADIAQSADGNTHQEYLVNLLAAELEYRKDCRKEKLLKGAGFYTIKTIKDFVSDEVQFPAETGLEELVSLDFVKDKWNVVMYGGTGRGKTHLSTALGVEACRKGLSVGFYRTAALVNRLSEAKANGTLSKLKDKLEKQELMILDECGYIPIDVTGSQLLFDIISERCERKSIILNTNLEFSNWGNVFYDHKMTAALLGRLLHHCHLLLFNGPDLRLKQSSINNMMYNHSVASVTEKK